MGLDKSPIPWYNGITNQGGNLNEKEKDIQ